ncbi:MlaD family protein [Rhodococcus sp. USK13]|uniref:MlaD family protein n=1 Tax=Rhodococcus sp. USK13 TaxID=2806442 RepID=UPI001BCFBC97|nr:MlaD family protein [Rhodococcus sp. USK13]
MAAASFAYMGDLGLNISPLQKVNEATMTVADTNGLVVGSRVLLRGVQIGHVTALNASANGVELEWNYDRNYEIPVESTFRVDNMSALGEGYISIQSGSSEGPFLENRSVVNSSRVSQPTSFQDFSKRLTLMLEQVDPDRVREIFASVDVALPEDARVLNNLSRAGELLANEIITRRGDLNKLLQVMQPLLQQSAPVPYALNGVTPNIVDFGQGFANVINRYFDAVDLGSLPDGITYGVEPFLNESQAFLDKNVTDLHVIGSDLLPSMTAAAASLRTIPISDLLTNALAAADAGDAITLHLHGLEGG